MPESKRLLEAEATVALDRDDESGTRLVVPEEAVMSNAAVSEIAVAELLRLDGQDEGPLSEIVNMTLMLVRSSAEYTYPRGFDDGRKSRDAEVAELQRRLEMPITIHGDYVERIERDVAIDQVRVLIEAGDGLVHVADVNGTEAIEAWESAKKA